MRVENLPSADVEDNSVSCDVCTKKGIEKVPAATYCTMCCKLFCRKHEEVILLIFIGKEENNIELSFLLK